MGGGSVADPGRVKPPLRGFCFLLVSLKISTDLPFRGPCMPPLKNSLIRASGWLAVLSFGAAIL